MPWLPERPRTSPRLESSAGANVSVAALSGEPSLPPLSVIPQSDKMIEGLQMRQVQLEEKLSALRAQERELIELESSQPRAASCDGSLLAGQSIAAQWLSEQDQDALSRDQARRQRQEGRLRVGKMPQAPTRSSRDNLRETLRVVRARERHIANEKAVLETQVLNSTRPATSLDIRPLLTPSASLPAL